MSEPEYSRSYEIRELPVCKMCGEPIRQYAASSTFEAEGKCECGEIWKGYTIMDGSAQIKKWFRVEKPEPLPKPAPESRMLWGDMGLFIEEVEEAIRRDVAEYGRVPKLPPNRERIGDSADRLASKLVTMVNKLAVELGMSGDPNITFMHCLSMISYAWTVFILEAKSRADQRYPEASLKYMKFLVDSNPDLFRKIHEQAVKHGDEYPVDNPKWAAAVAKYEAKQRSKLPQDETPEERATRQLRIIDKMQTEYEAKQKADTSGIIDQKNFSPHPDLGQLTAKEREGTLVLGRQYVIKDPLEGSEAILCGRLNELPKTHLGHIFKVSDIFISAIPGKGNDYLRRVQGTCSCGAYIDGLSTQFLYPIGHKWYWEKEKKTLIKYICPNHACGKDIIAPLGLNSVTCPGCGGEYYVDDEATLRLVTKKKGMGQP